MDFFNLHLSLGNNLIIIIYTISLESVPSRPNGNKKMIIYFTLPATTNIAENKIIS